MSTPTQHAQLSPFSSDEQAMMRTYAQVAASPPGSPRRETPIGIAGVLPQANMNKNTCAPAPKTVNPLSSPSPFTCLPAPASFSVQDTQSQCAPANRDVAQDCSDERNEYYPTEAPLTTRDALEVPLNINERAEGITLERRIKKRPRHRSPRSSMSSISAPSTPAPYVNVADGGQLAQDVRPVASYRTPPGVLAHSHARVSSDRPLERSLTATQLGQADIWMSSGNTRYPAREADSRNSSVPWNVTPEACGVDASAATGPMTFTLRNSDSVPTHDQQKPAMNGVQYHAARQLFANEPDAGSTLEMSHFTTYNSPFPLLPPMSVDEMPRPRNVMQATSFDWPPSTPRIPPTMPSRLPTPFTLPKPLLSRPIVAAQPLILEDDEHYHSPQTTTYPLSSNLAHPSLTGAATRTQQSAAATFVFTTPPPGGFPPMSFWDRDSLVQDLPPLRVEAIDKPECDAILLQIWNVNRPRQNELTSIRSTLSLAIRSGTGASNFQLFAPEPRWAAPGVPATDPATWIGLNIPQEARERLITIGVWSSKSITFFAYPCERVIPRFLFMLNGFTGNHNNDVSKAIATALRSDASWTHLELLFAGHKRYSKLARDDAMRAFLATVRISMQPLTSGNFVTSIYCDPPTDDDVHRWRAWRQVLTTLDYSTPFCGTGTFRMPSPCLGCHGADHLTHLCPYPQVPGWNAPPAGDRGRTQQEARAEGHDGASTSMLPPQTVPHPLTADHTYARQRGGPFRQSARGASRRERGARLDKSRYQSHTDPY